MAKGKPNSRDKKASRVVERGRFSGLTKTRLRQLQRKDGAVGAFSDSTASQYFEGKVMPPRFDGRILAHPPQRVINAIRMCYEVGVGETSRRLGLPYSAVHTWFHKRFLPKTGIYCFAEVIRLVRRARTIYQIADKDPLWCLKEAVGREPKMKWGSVKSYLFRQAMPTLPGFPMYADRKVNQKAEEYGLGLRRYSAVLGVEPPNIPAVVDRLSSRTPQTGQRGEPRQLGRKFVVEGQVTSRLPRRDTDLL